MADTASRRGAADLGMPLMIITFLLVGGFMYWLYAQAKAERAMEIVEEVASDTGDLSGATTVAGADIQLDASPFEGQFIRLAGYKVASQLGTQGFWITMPNGNPFLVSMTEDVVAEGMTVSVGSTATVIGTVYAVNDSVLTAWMDAATIGEGDRLAAEFATHFLEAVRVEIAGSGGED